MMTKPCSGLYVGFNLINNFLALLAENTGRFLLHQNKAAASNVFPRRHRALQRNRKHYEGKPTACPNSSSLQVSDVCVSDSLCWSQLGYRSIQTNLQLTLQNTVLLLFHHQSILPYIYTHKKKEKKESIFSTFRTNDAFIPEIQTKRR